MQHPTPAEKRLAVLQEQRRRACRNQGVVRQLCRSWLAEHMPNTYQQIQTRAKQMLQLESR